jgi:hypothetical protein
MMNMSIGTSKEAFAFHKRWEKALLSTEIKLPKGCTRMGFVAYSMVMASHGWHGIECYASDDLVCRELGIYNRRDVAKYRNAAKELGWLTPSGKRAGRAERLNIAIPGGNPPADERAESSGAPKVTGNCEHPYKSFTVDGILRCDVCDAAVEMADR